MTTLNSLKARLAATTTKPSAPRPALPAAPANVRKGAKLCLSFYPADLDRIEAVRAFMADHGHRISTSQAVRLALRAVPLTEELRALLLATKAEDGRTK